MDDLTASLYHMQVGDAAENILDLGRDSIHCVITSPPYWNLQDYGADGQLGSEPVLDCHAACGVCYVCRLVMIFKLIYRRLHAEALVWLNLGDTTRDGVMLCIPWRVCFRLQACGFRLISEVIWYRGASPRIPVRPTPSHEYWFMFALTPDYYYDHTQFTVERTDRVNRVINRKNHMNRRGQVPVNRSEFGRYDKSSSEARLQSVWRMNNNAPFRDVHRAHFPQKMVETLVRGSTPEAGVCLSCGRFKASSPEAFGRKHHGACICGDIGAEPCLVLDPFAGSGMVPLVAAVEGRRGLGFEINPDTVARAVGFFHAQEG